ncbi:hypothetical protein AU254_02180 [Yersinia pestis]|nr:hypothetical protein AU254_02180 [Yersinia pestis]
MIEMEFISMIFKINVRWRDKIGDFWWGILCLLYLQIMIGMLPFKVLLKWRCQKWTCLKWI